MCVVNQGKSSAAAGTSFEAQESSLAEECDAICRLHGVPTEAPLAVQLKAIDAEYHQLLDKGQSAKADHVQALFAWKSKMAAQVLLQHCFSILWYTDDVTRNTYSKGKGKVFPYSLPSVGPGADPGVQAVSPQVT